MGAVLLIASIGAFIFLLGNAATETIRVLAVNEFVAEGQALTADNFRIEEIPKSSTIRYLEETAFNGIEPGDVLARADLAPGTIINRELIEVVDVDSEGGVRRNVIFSINIPSQGFPSGPLATGDRVMMIALFPAEDPVPIRYCPIQAEVVQGVNGSRIAFQATPSRAAQLQRTQFNVTDQGGYIFTWLLDSDLDQREVRQQAVTDFGDAGCTGLNIRDLP